MIRRTLLIAGLALAGTGATAMAVHPVTANASPPAYVAVQSAYDTSDQTDMDAAAACSTNATGEQTGNCTDSQNSGDSEQSSGATDALEATDESNR